MGHPFGVIFVEQVILTFKVDVSMSPIDWAWGLIALRRSEEDRVNGPMAYIELSGDEVVVRIEGYISLLGVSQSVKIHVTDEGYEFKLESKLWDVFHTKLHVKANYASLATLDFSVSI